MQATVHDQQKEYRPAGGGPGFNPRAASAQQEIGGSQHQQRDEDFQPPEVVMDPLLRPRGAREAPQRNEPGSSQKPMIVKVGREQADQDQQEEACGEGDALSESHSRFLALLYVFGYQFAPRYKDLYDKVRTSLTGFNPLGSYGNVPYAIISESDWSLRPRERPSDRPKNEQAQRQEKKHGTLRARYADGPGCLV